MNMLAGDLQTADDAQGDLGRERFAAFLSDERSERVVRECATGLGLPLTGIHRGDISTAIAYLEKARSPQALLVDIAGAEPALTRIHALADVCEPGVSVAAIGDRNDVGLFRDLLEAGISDYIVKPLPDALVTKAMSSLLGLSSNTLTPLAQKLGKVISVVGARGGIGASTIAANLAWSLANKKHRRVALIDLDLHAGACSHMLGLDAHGGLREALEQPARVDELFLHRAAVPCGPRLSVFCCEPLYQGTTRVDSSALQRLVGLLRKEYHYIVLDVPRRDGVLFDQALDFPGMRVILLDQTTLAIRDAVGLKEPLTPRPEDQRNILVLNRVGEQGKSGLAVAELEGVLGQKIEGMVPFDPKSVIAAANRGVPLVTERSPSAKAIEQLADTLGGHVQAAKRPWWKLFGR